MTNKQIESERVAKPADPVSVLREALKYYERAPWYQPGNVNADNGRIARAALAALAATEHAASQPAGDAVGLADAQVDSLRAVGSAWMSESGREALEDWIDAQGTRAAPPAAAIAQQASGDAAQQDSSGEGAVRG